MVAYLKKPEGSEGFYQIVDFLNASHIRYALTENPTIYVSLIKQFWEIATAKTLDNGDIELTATIDGKVKIVTEASVRRHLQLADSDGISSLPTTEIFEQLSLMGNMKRASKGYTGENIPLFPAMIVQGLVVQGEGSTHPPRSPTHSLIADEAASTGVDIIYGGATTTVTSLEAGQGSGNIDKTPTMPYDSPLPRVNTLGSDEGSMTLQELMVFCTTLSKKVESLETDLKQTKLTYGAAYTKLIKKIKKLENKVKSSQARRRARIIVSNDEDDLEDPSKQGRKIAETDQDPAILLDVSTSKPVSTAGVAVTTASVAVVSTASPTRRVSTANDITMAETLVYIRKSAAKDKGKGKMDESELVQTKTKLQQEQERLGYEAVFRLQAKLEEKESEVDRAVPGLAAGSSKGDVEEELDKESSKRDDLVMLWSLFKENFKSIEPTDDKEREIWVELKRLFEPDTDDELWKLQKHIHDLTWRLYDSCGVHHVSTEKGIDIYMLVEKEYPLSRGTLTLMLVAKLLVEQDNEMSRELLRKIFMQAERPRR
ncbi:hypothetical protein Tco_1031721 [Tanacetum coccineum]|uniref:Xylulose kinase-1 n=1 Tax=Tanacetum coccineum TaxID=301880 RepID=A0ABQ5GB96_9ASTR